MTVTTAADPDKRAPGRPRSARAEQAIIDAVLDLLADDVPIDTLSIEAVAAKAGVGKATIYRRWPSKEELIVEAVASLKLSLPALAGKSVVDDLLTLLRAVGREADPGKRRVVLCVMPHIQRTPELHGLYQRIIEPRRECMREVLRRGVRTGELRPDLDIEAALSMLTAPLILQNMANWNPALGDEPLPERLVSCLLGGAAGPAMTDSEVEA